MPVDIDWPTFDRLRGEGLSIRLCAKEMGIATGTLIRRACERVNGKAYRPRGARKDICPEGPYVGAPSAPRRFSWQDNE